MNSVQGRSRKLLMLGSSGTRFADPDEGRTLPELIEDELNSDSGGATWRVEAELLYPAANMRERALGYFEAHQPDALLLTLGATVFAEESVLFAIRRRFPRLYAPASRLIATGKSVAGGGSEGDESVRGTVFRSAGRLAGRVLGKAPLVAPQTALNATIATLEALASVPGLPVACRLANGHFQHKDQAAEVALRTETYNEAVRQACTRLGITVYGQRDSIEALGGQYNMGADGLHTDFKTRKMAAAVAAANVLEAVRLQTRAGSAV